MESSLFMRQATDASFRTYTLHAENSVAVTTADVTLVKSMHSETEGLSIRMGVNPRISCHAKNAKFNAFAL